ncbi:MAG: PAS domain S-box protein, partial [Candidatus Eremiobacteraeota bacterium]|nr:PAS domain S-box protein [Candidatus Eremiobacteraeota bacterium]
PQLPIEQVVGQPYELFIPPHDRARVRSIIDSVFATGEAAGYDTEARAPDGSVLGWYACRVGPIMVEGAVESVVIIASNITERRQIEEELRHSRAQLRRLTARQQTALEEERRHIARELHDELGQLLTALKIDLAWLEARLGEPALLDRTTAMTEIVSATMSTIRRISTRLRPQLLDDLGPRAALDWLTQEICERAGISCALRFDLAGHALSEDCALTVFRICQEALTNVVRHAEASHVSIEVKVEQAQLELSICDNGIGISDGQRDSSLGLLGLQERVHMLGGQVTITGTAQGTVVRSLLPLDR